jgi:penicillin-binding protein 4B
MQKRRIYFILLFIGILFTLLLLRLSQIQLFSTEKFGPHEINLLQKSVEQRSHQLVLSNGRGSITDRNGIPLTNKLVFDFIVFPGMTENDAEIDHIANVLGMSTADVAIKITNLDQPKFLSEQLNIELTEKEYNELGQLNISGLYPIERAKNEDPQLAQHFIGIVRENPSLYLQRYPENYFNQKDKPVGIAGLEESFDPFLVSKDEEKLLFHVDAKGEPMFGFDLLYTGYDNSFYPLTVQSTLDINLQTKAEELFEKYTLQKGGLVLLDVETRDVLAMVSRPKVNLNNPYEQNSLANQMLTSHFPGSVFKIVTALAAIDHIDNVNERIFDCSYNIYNEKDERNLGQLNFAESFSQSCNRAFGDLANELMQHDQNILEEYGSLLGILGPAGWSKDFFQYKDFQHFPNEEKGVIWGDEKDKGTPLAISQTAIGQKNVRVTPLAVANMMATIASDGIRKEVRGVQKIMYKSGAIMGEFPEEKHKSQLNSYSLNQLQQLLVNVTETGTAKSLNGLKIAGKSGTAEWYNEDSESPLNYWFAGYFPYDQPAYAMAVVDIENSLGKTNIYEIYKEMVEYIYSLT